MLALPQQVIGMNVTAEEDQQQELDDGEEQGRPTDTTNGRKLYGEI